MQLDIYTSVDLVFSVLVWTILLIFLIATMYWLFEMLIVGRARCGPIEYGLEDVEIRIMTIASEEVVQATVDVLPEELAAVRVVAERDITIRGATVHTVPKDFVCNATRKGRAIEWARQSVSCNGEYVLYLDEDTLLTDFHGLPDADIIQLSEHPIRSRSWFAYLAEIFRMGFQFEQSSFPKFRYPLYAWGGGFAIRKTVEDEVTWDVNSITEDTNFIWRAFEDASRDMAFLRVRAMNQAPPSVREMIHQRRRWISGAANDSHLLPYRYQLLSLLRNAAWGLVFLSPLLLIPLATPISVVFLPELYGLLIQVQIVGLFAWALLGYWYSGERLRVLLLLFISIPIVAIIHAAGAFWAIISPTDNFRVTQKVVPPKVEDEKVKDVVPSTTEAEHNQHSQTVVEAVEDSD